MIYEHIEKEEGTLEIPVSQSFLKIRLKSAKHVKLMYLDISKVSGKISKRNSCLQHG
jgi:hypothetical protein